MTKKNQEQKSKSQKYINCQVCGKEYNFYTITHCTIADLKTCLNCCKTRGKGKRKCKYLKSIETFFTCEVRTKTNDL